MRTVTVILCSLFLVAATSRVQAQTQSKLKTNEAEVTFVTNMHCEHCKKKIENTVAHEKGVVDMKVTLDTKEVWIKFNATKTTKADLQKAIEKLGYTATEKTGDQKDSKTTSEVYDCSHKM